MTRQIAGNTPFQGASDGGSASTALQTLSNTLTGLNNTVALATLLSQAITIGAAVTRLRVQAVCSWFSAAVNSRCVCTITDGTTTYTVQGIVQSPTGTCLVVLDQIFPVSAGARTVSIKWQSLTATAIQCIPGTDVSTFTTLTLTELP